MNVYELITELTSRTSDPNADVVIYTSSGDEFQFEVDSTCYGSKIRLQCHDVVSALATAKRELEEVKSALEREFERLRV